jgi:hypothetical protein
LASCKKTRQFHRTKILNVTNKKATGYDNVPGDVLKLLGEGGLKIMTKLINTIYGT